MKNVIESFLEATAWRIEQPVPYDSFHLIFTAVGVGLCLYLSNKLKSLTDKGNRVFFLSIGILLVLTEAYKQLFCFLVIDNRKYNLELLPFQLCSIPLYFCLIAPLLKPGHLQRAMYSFMMLYNFLGGIASFAEPSALLHPYITLTIHALLWHLLLILIGLYLIRSGKGQCEIRDYYSSTVIFLILSAIAFIINLLCNKMSGKNINLFFVGPGNSPLIILKKISERFGWHISTALYIPIVCLGAYVLFLLIRLYRTKNTNKS